MDAPPVQYTKTSDGYDIAYTVAGEGRPFVMMPGLGITNTELLWRSPVDRDFFEVLASHFRLVQYDSRGGGNSTRGLKPEHTRDDYLLDLEAVASRLGLQSFVLAASVFSAHPAICYAARHQREVSGLVLLNPTPAEGAIGLKNWEAIYRNSWELFVESFTRTFYLEDSEAWDWVDYFKAVTSQADFILMAEAMINSRIDELVPTIKTPTLVLALRNPSFPPLGEASKAYASNMPAARLVLYERDMHQQYPPDQIMPSIEEFVSGLPDPQERPPEVTSPGDLSERELEVLKLLAQGKSNPQIAEVLFITRNTVQNHVSSILIKLNLQNRAEATAYAVRNGIA